MYHQYGGVEFDSFTRHCYMSLIFGEHFMFLATLLELLEL